MVNHNTLEGNISYLGGALKELDIFIGITSDDLTINSKQYERILNHIVWAAEVVVEKLNGNN